MSLKQFFTPRSKSLIAQNPAVGEKQVNADLAVANVGIAARLERAEADLRSARSEVSRVNNELIGLNSEISRKALSIGCLVELRDPQMKNLLPSTASADEKQKAADAIPAGEKLTAIFSAVHASVARIGVDLTNKPAENPGGHTQVAGKMTRAAFLAMAPSAQTRFLNGNGKIVD